MFVTTQDLLAQGLSTARIRQRVVAGELRRLRRGLYEVGGQGEAPTPEAAHLRLIDSVVSQGRDTVLSHASAAVLHGLPMPAPALGRVHVLRASPRSGSKRKSSLYVHRTSAAIPMAEVAGLRVVPLDRTVLDVVRVLRPHDGVAVVDKALRSGVPKERLLALLTEQSRRRGNQRAREVIEFGDGRAESPGESWARWMLASAGLPVPELQQKFHDPWTGRMVARTDFFWREQGVVGEFDGAIKYGRLLRPGQSVSEVVLAEKKREEDLRRLGVWVVRFCTGDIWQPDLLGRIVRDGFAFARPSVTVHPLGA